MHNPEAAAGEIAAEFHGAPGNEIEEIHEQVHEHEYLGKLATLLCLRVETESHYKAEIKFPEAGKRSEVRLAVSEDGTSLYIVGGDQSLDLRALHMGGEKWRKDLMVIGRVKEMEYWTAKGMDDFKPSVYWHKSREGLSKDGTRHVVVSEVDSVLLYDSRSALLSFAGGQSYVDRSGVVG